MKTIKQYNIQQTFKTIGLSILLFFASAHKVAATMLDSGYSNSNYFSSFVNGPKANHQSGIIADNNLPSGNHPGLAQYLPNYINNIYNGNITSSEIQQDKNVDNEQETEKSNEELVVVEKGGAQTGNVNLEGLFEAINQTFSKAKAYHICNLSQTETSNENNPAKAKQLSLSNKDDNHLDQPNRDKAAIGATLASDNGNTTNNLQVIVYTGPKAIDSSLVMGGTSNDKQKEPVQLSGLNNDKKNSSKKEEDEIFARHKRIVLERQKLQEKQNGVPSNEENNSDEFSVNDSAGSATMLLERITNINKNKQNGYQNGSALVMLHKDEKQNTDDARDSTVQRGQENNFNKLRLDSNINEQEALQKQLNEVEHNEQLKQDVKKSKEDITDIKNELDLAQHRSELNEENAEEIEQLEEIVAKEKYVLNKQGLTVEQQRKQLALMEEILALRKGQEQVNKESQENKKKLKQKRKELNLGGNQAMSQASKTNVSFQINPGIMFLYLLCAYFIRYIYVNFPKFNVPMLIRV